VASARWMLGGAGLADRVREINERAVAAALKAADGTSTVVAGSLSHMVPIRQGTGVANPGALPPDTEIADALRELAQILAAAGCELIILEMMYHPARIRPALKAALATGLPVWYGASARRGSDGRPISFNQSDAIPLEAVASLIPR